ncbi:uncharacterized protein LOC118750337 [Rhagoletis pomonella]|uniref:uncharacterized protein LOC118750337 n=1 Tax=Rhagoletis pomonella TaxID=28610 RepID=UPI001780FF89|nr:uncharacterized protein LOC118750337 [Rhagoletis pomonella]
MTRFTVLRTKTEMHSEEFAIACRLCNKNHGVRLCPIYRSKSAEERLREVLIHRYCPNCLSPFHRLEICSSTDRCHRCREKHHTSLHIDNGDGRRKVARGQTDEDDSSQGALSIHVTEQTKSWAQQVEEEEREQNEGIAESVVDDVMVPSKETGSSKIRTF